MIEQTLFDVGTPIKRPDVMAVRQKAIEAAYDHANERFKAEYEALVRRFAERGQTFIGQDVQEAYKADRRLPQPKEWRSTGYIYQKLKKEGVIVEVGFRKRNQGNPTPEYCKA